MTGTSPLLIVEVPDGVSTGQVLEHEAKYRLEQCLLRIRMSADGSVGEKRETVFQVQRDRPMVRVGISEQDAAGYELIVREELPVVPGIDPGEDAVRRSQRTRKPRGRDESRERIVPDARRQPMGREPAEAARGGETVEHAPVSPRA